MKRLLLHTCCGPCFLGVWEDLKSGDYEVTNFFYNPNIWPEEEYQKRMLNLKEVTRLSGTKFIEGNYRPKDHDKAVRGKEKKFPERCLECYRIRLEETAKNAKNKSFESFSTTLLVSPYQNHEALVKIGAEMAQKYDVDFLATDWRPFFRKGQETAKYNDIYRQKYCGCKHSLKESRK